MEEPAPYGVFLLLTPAAQNLLPTVLSRCVVLKCGEGPPGLVSESDKNLQATAQEIIKTAHTQDILGALALYKKFEPLKESKESVQALLDMLYAGYGGNRAFNAVKAVTRAKQALAQNGNFQLAIELMLLNIAGRLPHKAGAEF
jgi:hypothetical protein